MQRSWRLGLLLVTAQHGSASETSAYSYGGNVPPAPPYIGSSGAYTAPPPSPPPASVMALLPSESSWRLVSSVAGLLAALASTDAINTILLADGTYLLPSALQISRSVTLRAATHAAGSATGRRLGGGGVTLDGQHSHRVLVLSGSSIHSGISVVIDGLTITNGKASSATVGYGDASGGCIRVHSGVSLIITGASIVQYCYAEDSGGGIYHENQGGTGQLSITGGSTVQDCRSDGLGGGIFTSGSGVNRMTVTSDSSNIRRNSAPQPSMVCSAVAKPF